MNVFSYIWARTQVAMVFGYHIFLVYKSWLVYKNPRSGLEENIRLQFLTFVNILTSINHGVGVSNGRHYVGLNGNHGFVKTEKGKYNFWNLSNWTKVEHA